MTRSVDRKPRRSWRRPRIRTGVRGGIAATGAMFLWAMACNTPSALELGEHHYREGDRLAALETWGSVRSNSPDYEAVARRISEVEAELARSVVLFKKRGAYYERKGRLAESVLNYRLALKLEPDDRATLDRVRSVVQSLTALSEEARAAYAEASEAGDLVAARSHLAALRTLDPFDPRLATDERQLEYMLEREAYSLLATGRRAFSSGDLRSAERAFHLVLQLDPENESARGHLSFIAKIRAIAQTRDEEKDAAQTPPRRFDPPQVHATDEQIRAERLFQSALRSEQAGDLFAAIQFDIDALEADPRHPTARVHLLALRSRLPSAEDLIQVGRDHYQQENLEAALEQWRRALLIDPDNSQALEYVERAERGLALTGLSPMDDTPAPIPAPPSGFTAQSFLPRKVALTWNALEDPTVAGYMIYRSPTQGGEFRLIAQIDGASQTSYVDRGLGTLRLLYYRIAAFTAAGAAGRVSSEVHAVTKPEPLPPAGLAVVERRLGVNVLGWEPNLEEDIAGYRLWRRKEFESSDALVATLGTDETRAEDRNIGVDERVWYWLTAFDSDDLESNPSERLEVRSRN